jgi:hypothetical protein
VTISVASFRADLPEFGDASAFPDSQITYWIAIAVMMLPVARWGLGSAAAASPPTTKLDFATEMFVAHNVSIERQAVVAAAGGAAPGLQTGAVSGASQGSESISYDSGSGLEIGAGHWNLTVYGTRFVKLAKFVGMGPVQVSGGFCPPPFSGPAWPGPWPYPEQGDTGF